MLWSYWAKNVDERALLVHANIHAPIIITDMNERIVGVNTNWVRMCQFSAEEAFGKTPRILQGSMTNSETARDFSLQLRGGGPAHASLLNYKKDGSAFVNRVCGRLLGDLLIAETVAEYALEEEGVPPRGRGNGELNAWRFK